MSGFRVALILAAVAGVIYLGWYYSRSSCTLGYAGTAMTITVNGQGAGDWCDRELVRDRTGAAYKTSERTNDILICRYPLGGLTYTVRDQGSFYLVGSDTCSRYKAIYESERGVAPAPTR